MGYPFLRRPGYRSTGLGSPGRSGAGEFFLLPWKYPSQR